MELTQRQIRDAFKDAAQSWEACYEAVASLTGATILDDPPDRMWLCCREGIPPTLHLSPEQPSFTSPHAHGPTIIVLELVFKDDLDAE